MTRIYKVVMKDKTEFKVKAEDVELSNCSSDHENCNVHYYNFLVNGEDGSDYDPDGDYNLTVAAVPYDAVMYIAVEY